MRGRKEPHDHESFAPSSFTGWKASRARDGPDVVRSFRNVRQPTDRGPRTGQARPVASEFIVGTATAQRPASAAPAVPPAGEALRVLVVDSRTLHGLAAKLLQSPGDVLSATCDTATTVCADEQAFDIVLLAVIGSTLAAMGLAAHLRAVERQKPHPQRAGIIACTLRTDQYHDCLVPGSGLSDALHAPWTPGTVHACLDRWRGVKFLPGLDRAATRIY